MIMNKVYEYIREYLQLVYWFYFKQYTLRRWLKDIHPELDINTNPFFLGNEFTQNTWLQQYANRMCRTNTLIVFLFLLVIPSIASSFDYISFNWIKSGLTCIIYLVNIWLIQIRLVKQIYISKVLVGAGSCILIISILLFNSQFDLTSIGLVACILNGLIISIFCNTFCNIFIPCLMTILYLSNFLFFALGNTLTSITISIVPIAIFLERCIAIQFNSKRSIFIAPISIVASIVVTILIGISAKANTINIIVLFIGVAFMFAMLRVYFWIPELIWMLGLQFFSNHNDKSYLLCRLPPYFDQLIILPLPFMAKIIIKSYRQNPVAARSSIDYFITSTNQQAVAKKAMFGIGIETLNQCRYVSDIIGSQIQLDWLPTDEKTFGKVLPRLLEISHDIDIAYQATTAYNKLELVDRSISDLQKLQTSLSTAASASDAPLFGTITMRWLQILKDNRQALETAAQASAEIPNPYLAGSSLEPADAKERFKGRQDLFREIEKISLSAQPPVLLLYGKRRTGKTSTLKYLPSRVSSDLIPLLVDFQGAASIQRVENIARFMAEAITKTAKSSRNLILPTISLEQLSSDPFYALQIWMEQIERVAPNKRFLLCIDEFERLEEVISTSGSRAPLNFLRYVTQNCRQWIVLFSGSHRLEELEPYWSDYLIGTRTLSITYLQESEARELIQHPVSTFPDIYLPDAVDEILSLTHRQPYLVQLLCSCIVEYINDANRKSVTVPDVEAAKQKALERGAAYFKEFSDTLTPAQRDFIHRLLAHETFNESDLMVIRQLIQSEIIEKDANGKYRFQVPLIEQYIREKSLM